MEEFKINTIIKGFKIFCKGFYIADYDKGKAEYIEVEDVEVKKIVKKKSIK